MKIHRAACVLLLLLTCACERVHVSTIEDLKLEDLPPGAAESFRKHWPDAQVESISRVYNVNSWGDYRLNFKVPGGGEGFAVLSKAGEIKQSLQYPARERS